MKFGIIGLGEYGTSEHLPAAQHAGTIAAVADVGSAQARVHALCPDAVFLNAEELTADEIAERLHAEQVDACIVSTPPEVRRPYLEALLRRKIPVLSDKPLTFPPKATEDIVRAREIWTDFEAIAALSKKQRTPVWIHAQKRYDKTLWLLQEQMHTGIAALHYLEISKTDGQERTPEEMDRAKHHSYHDEGMMAHSAYHHVDYVMQLLKRLDYDSISIDTKALRAGDAAQLQFGEGTAATGEVDVHITLQAKKDVRVVCTVQLSLRHTGTSSRDLTVQPENWTKGSGRVKQEHLLAHFGHDVTVRCQRVFAPDGPQGKQHLETSCDIIRNPRVGLPEHETLRLAGADGTYAESSRGEDFKQFVRMLQGKGVTDNLLDTHENSIKLYAAICESLARLHNRLGSHLDAPFISRRP